MKFIVYIFAINCFVTCTLAQQPDREIEILDSLLQQKSVDAAAILSKESYLPLHSRTTFRNLIRKYAPVGSISIITPSEPGKKITVRCRFTNEQGKPYSGALVYFYQTSAKGWYSDTAAHIRANEGDMRHARLFGYVISDLMGQIEISTIQPAGYPQSDFPAHIHIMITSNQQHLSGYPGELLFEEDERLTPARRKEALASGFLISKNSGTLAAPVYEYRFSLKQPK